ncbi:MAG: hypothetical protein IKU25_04935 [Clostridia bacterium]|nr:hypothetical protein [Clostridia bacterium]
MTLSERVAYLKGLAEGLAIDENKPEAKIINCMIDILDDIALSVMDLEDKVAVIGEQLDEVDQDLADVEDIIYDDEDDDCDCDCDCDCCEDETFEIVCPNCGEEIYVDEEILEDGSIECPNCGEKLEFEFDIDCDCDCCDED